MLARTLRFVQLLELLLALAAGWWLHVGWQWPVAGAMLAGLAAPLMLHAAIIALDFALAAWVGGPAPKPLRLGISSWLRTYLTELLDSIWLFQWSQAWRPGRALPGQTLAWPLDRRLTPQLACAKHPVPARPDAPVPVVLVHGYFCNRQVWGPLARWLSMRGHPLIGVDLEPLFCPIDDYLPLLDDAVRALQAATGAPEVALVCHSMGGLVARAYLRRHPRAAVRCVVTLGTPHRGTVHARLGTGANVRQMRPDSTWLRELAATETKETNARYTVIFSHHDNIVAPHQSQQLPGARNIGLGGLGHLSLALNERTWRVVADALDR